MIEADLRTALLASAAVTALVEQRVAAGVLPEGEVRPYITYALVAGQRLGSLSSSGATRQARMQLNCFSANYGQAKAIAEAAQEALEASALFEAVFNGDQDTYDPTAKLHGVILDYSLWQSPA
ncbi:Protein of unknown function [Azotobacter beijerinckii]|uniref:DUF3168 domain-containing protein n=1 Tax=Azotobacter beijerinckii TaxID=170623 RepID=A0A1H6Y3B0_9GAMM|nr:DUF3168 domain-containing protein [Azotobacter beijerinckii]SEJ31620.1 Protein of unknown function [Azotobacter beijerinckii]